MVYTLSEDKQTYTVSELMDSGLSYYKINKLAEDGKLERLNKSTYLNTSYKGDFSDFSFVSSLIPKGIVCMMSAARFYNLTSFIPDAVDMAIERSMKVSTVPNWPPVKIWYFPNTRYETGVVSASDSGGTFRIFDIEKTVADILYYRNKTGIEETGEVLRNYLAGKDRNLVKLRRYANELGCGRILGTYLEVLL